MSFITDNNKKLSTQLLVYVQYGSKLLINDVFHN